MTGIFKELLLPIEDFSFKRSQDIETYHNVGNDFYLTKENKGWRWGLNRKKYAGFKYSTKFSQEFEIYQTLKAAKESALYRLNSPQISAHLKRYETSYRLYCQETATPLYVFGTSGNWQIYNMIQFYIEQMLGNNEEVDKLFPYISKSSNPALQDQLEEMIDLLVFKTRQDVVKALSCFVSHNLNQLYTPQAEQVFQTYLQTDYEKIDYTNLNVIKIWWRFFVKPEIDLKHCM